MTEKLRFIFCEGDDDFSIISEVIRFLGITNIIVERYHGKDNLRNFLMALPTRPEFGQQKVSALAVVRDADDDLTAAFTSVHNALKCCKYSNCPKNNGEIAGSNPKIGIFIVGPRNGKGMVEDLCLMSVSNQPEYPCVEAYFRCIEEKSGRKNFSAKARLRVWMSSHVDYDLRAGRAAKDGYWPWEHTTFDELKRFLTALSTC